MNTPKTTASNLIGQMKKLTILKVFCVLYILTCIGYAIVNWEILTQAEGWGMVYMIGLISFGIVGLVADLILLILIGKTWILHIIEALIVFFFSIELWIELN